MKYITLIIGLLVVGCGEVENGAYKHRPKQTDTNESTPTTNTNEVSGTTEKPAKELTAEEKKVIGTYEMKGGFSKSTEFTIRAVLLDNGICEWYTNGNKLLYGARWEIVKEGIHVKEDLTGYIKVFRINEDGSITIVARIDKDGKRKEAPEGKHHYSKIK